MKTVPPILHPDDIDMSVIDDIRDAALAYRGEYAYTDAFDDLVTTPESAAVLAQLLEGKCTATVGLQCLHERLLGRWGSARSLTPANNPGIEEGLEKAVTQLHSISCGTQLEHLTDEQSEMIIGAFEILDNCRGVGATIASKIIAALHPAAAVMWDIPIAEAYGFARLTAGYRRFLDLMREVSTRLREISNGRDLEEYFKPNGRKWKAPLAKVIDEWHWIRITKSLRYTP